MDEPSPTVSLERVEWQAHASLTSTDTLVCEEPLEIRLRGIPIAVVMRTPGHDQELVRGFLRTENIVEDVQQVRSIRACSEIDDPASEGNVVQVTLDPSCEVDVARLRRQLYTTSSCGVCGKASLEQAMQTSGRLDDERTLPIATLYGLPTQLRVAQPVFSATGGLHAAGLFDASGEMLVVREDVGRHNAVDKVLGWAWSQPELQPLVLLVSGRVSFEIVQKALAGRIPIVAAVSAPSSLAVQLARESGITLAAFLRGQRCSVYAHAQRLVVG